MFSFLHVQHDDKAKGEKKYFTKNSRNLFITFEISFVSILLFKLLNLEHASLEYIFLMALNLIMLIALVTFISNK